MGCMPPTWRKVTHLAVGGLTEVGFAARRLLVVSHQGRAVVDLASGDLLARDPHEVGAWLDTARGGRAGDRAAGRRVDRRLRPCRGRLPDATMRRQRPKGQVKVPLITAHSPL
jgi:hypothetical protein